MSDEAKLLGNINTAGLEALANVTLAPQSQSRLDQLLQRNSEGKISDEELEELDGLLGQIDELNLLKARAQFTLRHQPETGSS